MGTAVPDIVAVLLHCISALICQSLREKKKKLAQPVVGQASTEPKPLGSVTEGGEDKDDEERQLESVLFGIPFKLAKRNGQGNGDGDGSARCASIVGKETENLMDEDLFYLDSGVPPDVSLGAEDEPDGLASPPSHISDDSDDSDDPDRDASSAAVPAPPPTSKRRTAWEDPDDANLNVSLASSTRLRKLRDTASDDVVGGREYERRLRRQYERIHPTPQWALNARKKLAPKRTRSVSASSDDTDDGEETRRILSSTNGVLASSERTRTRALPSGTIAIERLRDANQAAPSDGDVKVVRFHPSPQIPVLLTTGADRRARLFNIDGLTNPHLQTLHIPSLPLTTASFHPSGSSILFTGPRPFHYTYDLQSGATQRSPRGLWGTTFNAAQPAAQDASMAVCAFSPDGALLAVAGRRGYVHLVDWSGGSGAHVIGSVKMNTPVKDVWWATASAGHDLPQGRTLMSLGEDSTVYVWDVAERKCLRRWQDDGGFGSKIMSGDAAGKYLTIGSNTGLVNIYGPAHATSDKPKPLKTIGNLTTSISGLRFNHDSQLLAMSSKDKKDQMRLIHLPSLTAFANWPTFSTPLGHVTSFDFSAGSEYIAIGNNRGRVLLYHLRDFASQ